MTRSPSKRGFAYEELIAPYCAVGFMRAPEHSIAESSAAAEADEKEKQGEPEGAAEGNESERHRVVCS